jgi:hypothetical protein
VCCPRRSGGLLPSTLAGLPSKVEYAALGRVTHDCSIHHHHHHAVRALGDELIDKQPRARPTTFPPPSHHRPTTFPPLGWRPAPCNPIQSNPTTCTQRRPCASGVHLRVGGLARRVPALGRRQAQARARGRTRQPLLTGAHRGCADGALSN